jgi:hypothetical protein
MPAFGIAIAAEAIPIEALHMFTSRNVRTLLAALIALAGSAAVLSGNANAYQCKGYPTQAVGVHKLRAVAHAKAPKNWTASVKNQFGLSWSVWSIAQAKSINCNKQPDRWICLASAKPCNYVVP